MAIGTQTIVTGARSNVNTGSTNLKVRDVEDKVTQLPPYLTPIDDFFVTGKMKSEVTTGEYSKFEWYEDAFLPDVTTLSGGITGGSNTEATVTVAADIFLQYDTILVEATGEICTVTSATTGSINIQLVGTGNITAAAANTRIQRLVPAFVEAGSKQSALTVLAVQKYGYCQILKKGLSMTGRQQAAKSYGGDDWNYQWIKAGKEIREGLERTFLHNKDAYLDAAGAAGKSYTTGFGSLSTNLLPYTDSIDREVWDAGIRQIAENGKSSYLIAFAGGAALQDISNFGTSPFTYSQQGSSMTVDKVGIATAVDRKKPRIFTYQHPMCMVDVVWNPQLKGTKYDGYVLVINPDNVKKRYMANDKKGSRKYRVEMGIETPGADQTDAQYLFDQGLQIKLEESHGWFTKA